MADNTAVQPVAVENNSAAADNQNGQVKEHVQSGRNLML